MIYYNITFDIFSSVANDEMWNAKVRYAMLAYENAQQAEAKKDLESAATNLIISYNLYKKAIEVRKITLEIFQDFILYLRSESKRHYCHFNFEKKNNFHLEQASKIKTFQTAGKDETGLPLAPAHWFKNCGLLHPKLLTIRKLCCT